MTIFRTANAGRGNRLHAGFTLIELMVTVAVLGILLSVGIPALRDMMLNSKRSTAVNELLSSMMMARSEANKLGQQVTVCPIDPSNAAKCGTNWKQGVIVFNNPDEDDVVDTSAHPPATEQVIRSFPLNASEYNGFSIVSNQTRYTFKPFNGRGTRGTIEVCDPRDKNTTSQAEPSRALIINQSGRAYVDDRTGNGENVNCG